MDLPQLKLIQDVETRWSTEYAMLDRLVSLREAVAAELSASNVDSLLQLEWKLASGLVEVMKPFTDATKECCGNNYPTASMVIPTIHCLEFGTGVPFARYLLKTFRSRFPMYKMDDVNVLCTMLDPRYKVVVFNDYETQHAVNLLKREIKVKSTEVAKTPYKTQDTLKFGLSGSTASSKAFSNPYAWWKEHQECFPSVAQVALRYLSLSATQVASERVFSTAGNIITNRRELLLPHHVEQLTSS
ncbi:hypothetical protein PR048_005116 [Dryococelus australis]|uniref:HAT C-terminal dimerisation domain-containing protein n=1 Tax=Dryococelus australis TaxID=614101 RepID=A0ABQ9I7B6_9NEOP|nr:hypothetical protein PR048_005116 [Dryococelus australis]